TRRGNLLKIGFFRGSALIGFSVFVVQRRTFFDVDTVAGFVALDQLDVIANLALERHVGDEAVPGFGVDARHVPGVGVAVGVAIFDVVKQNKLVTVGDRLSHDRVLLKKN